MPSKALHTLFRSQSQAGTHGARIETSLPFQESNSPLLIKGQSHSITQAKRKIEPQPFQEQLIQTLRFPNLAPPFEFTTKPWCWFWKHLGPQIFHCWWPVVKTKKKKYIKYIKIQSPTNTHQALFSSVIKKFVLSGSLHPTPSTHWHQTVLSVLQRISPGPCDGDFYSEARQWHDAFRVHPSRHVSVLHSVLLLFSIRFPGRHLLNDSHPTLKSLEEVSLAMAPTNFCVWLISHKWVDVYHL